MGFPAASSKRLTPQEELVLLRDYEKRLRTKIHDYREEGRPEYWIKDLEKSLSLTLAFIRGLEAPMKKAA